MYLQLKQHAKRVKSQSVLIRCYCSIVYNRTVTVSSTLVFNDVDYTNQLSLKMLSSKRNVTKTISEVCKTGTLMMSFLCLQSQFYVLRYFSICAFLRTLLSSVQYRQFVKVPNLSISENNDGRRLGVPNVILITVKAITYCSTRVVDGNFLATKNITILHRPLMQKVYYYVE